MKYTFTLAGIHMPFTKLLVVFLLIIAGFTSSAQIGWTHVPSPNFSDYRTMIRGISGTSSNDIWTVGTYQTSPQMAQYKSQSLIMRWNGSNWQQYPAPSLGVNLNDLWDVEMTGVNDGWAVGDYDGYGAGSNVQMLRWDGSSWNLQSLPNPGIMIQLNSLDAVNANDIWAVGRATNYVALALHYNGSSWSHVSVPAVGSYRNQLLAVDAISSNDAWAVGSYSNSYGDYHVMAMHWNGSSWTNSTLPAFPLSQLGELMDVRMVSANDVWAVGSYLTGGMVMLHWDGSSWSEVNTTAGGGGAFAVLASNNVWAVGGEIAHWNGTEWTKRDSLVGQDYPALAKTVVLPNGDIWAAGRTVDQNNVFRTLVYRTVNSTPQFTNGTTQNVPVATNSSGNTLDELLKTQQSDVSQIMTYSIVSAPSHGTLSNFPATGITSNGFAKPNGTAYTPAAGYTGPDAFSIKVSVGEFSAVTTINVSVGSALPVTLTNFEVKSQQSSAILSWTTTTEINTSHFVIGHSTDGTNFRNVATVTAAGNSNVSKNYSYVHNGVVNGKNYYRLTSVDADGRSLFSEIKSITKRAGLTPQVSIYPNPVHGKTINLLLDLADGNYNVNVNAEGGEKIYSVQINHNAGNAGKQITLPKNLAAGTYYLSVENAMVKASANFLVR